jgi:hypothetical protein
MHRYYRRLLADLTTQHCSFEQHLSCCELHPEKQQLHMRMHKAFFNSAT